MMQRRPESTAGLRLRDNDRKPAVASALQPMNPSRAAHAEHDGPLLIAIHGTAAAGKTTLAARLAADLGDDLAVVGWLQPALDPRPPTGGAPRYGWQPLDSDSEPFDWLLRDESLQPPYREAEGAAALIDAWLDQRLAATDRIDVAVIDEIGSIELAGGGHRQRLLRLRERDPGALVIVVNTRSLEAVEALIEQRFDLRVDAADPGALSRLRDALVARRDYERAGWFGALAGSIEVGAGSVVHGAKIPFGGLGMATTQAALLTRAAEPMIDRGRVAWVAVLSAAIKSLSPAGQRLRPMLAIVVQGWLFARALRLLGWNLGGVMVGGFLMGLWAGSQGLLVQWLLLGEALVIALQTFADEAAALLGWPSPGLGALLLVWLAMHGSAVALGTAIAWRRERRGARALRLPSWLPPLVVPERRGWGAAILQAGRDLLRPAFWLPLLLVLGALSWAGQSGEAVVWVALRALLIAWLMFVLVQRIDLPSLPGKLRRLGMWGPAIAWRRALASLGERQR